MFYEKFTKSLDKHAPVKQKRVKVYRQPEWYNSNIIECRNLRDFYHRQKDWINYRYWRNKATSCTRKSKTKYFTTAISQNKDSKTLWKYLNELHPKQNPGVPIRMWNGEYNVSNDIEIANCIENHYSNFANTIKIYDPKSNHTFLKEFLANKIDENNKQLFSAKRSLSEASVSISALQCVLQGLLYDKMEYIQCQTTCLLQYLRR